MTAPGFVLDFGRWGRNHLVQIALGNDMAYNQVSDLKTDFQ